MIEELQPELIQGDLGQNEPVLSGLPPKVKLQNLVELIKKNGQNQQKLLGLVDLIKKTKEPVIDEEKEAMKVKIDDLTKNLEALSTQLIQKETEFKNQLQKNKKENEQQNKKITEELKVNSKKEIKLKNKEIIELKKLLAKKEKEVKDLFSQVKEALENGE